MEQKAHSYPGGTLPLLTSPLLGAAPGGGFAHGFPTRAGGVSPPPYESLNFGRGWGDAAAHVAENRRRIQVACGGTRLALARQVHGAVVRVVTDDTTTDETPPDADAVVCHLPGVAVGVFSADCVPLLMADVRTGAVAAVHAGWRGVIAGVAPAAISAMQAGFGTRASDLRVAIGPAIGLCCFEVGDEVAATFRSAFPEEAAEGSLTRLGPRGKPHVDLKRALARQLADAGVGTAQVDVGPECTRCDPEGRFYSYRRDNTKTGQHLAIIVARAAIPPG